MHLDTHASAFEGSSVNKFHLSLASLKGLNYNPKSPYIFENNTKKSLQFFHILVNHHTKMIINPKTIQRNT